MSTYFYLVCEAHHEYMSGCSLQDSGPNPLAGDEVLPRFVYKHRACALHVESEHQMTDRADADPMREMNRTEVVT